MTVDMTDVVEALRAHTNNGCFACGLDNPIGLHVDGFKREGDEITASFAARPGYQGIVGSLHGGIAATTLDEILVWAGILLEGVLTVTGTMDLRYRTPLGNAGTYRLRGRVDERTGRRLRLSGEVELAGQPAVTARGLYLVSTTVDEILAGHAAS